jgi:small subunit ribosomal protein S16
MATVIRLKRGGRTHSPYYRVIVMDSRTRALGREIDAIGIYHPCAKPAPVIEIDVEKAVNWLGKGAKTSDTVHNIFTKKGIFVQAAARAASAGTEPAVEPAPVAEAIPMAEAVAMDEAVPTE